MKPIMYLLLVEDNSADAHLIIINLNRIIGDHKFDVKLAQTLEDALGMLAAFKPDCILLDLTLPRTGGIDTFRAIRLTQPATPILILTGLYDKDLALQAVSEGAGGYMLKSAIRPDTLELNIYLAIQSARLNLLRSQSEKVSQMAGDVQEGQLAGRVGMLAMCSACGRIRDESILVEEGDMDDKWIRPDAYLDKHGIDITHSYCPNCMAQEVGKVVRG